MKFNKISKMKFHEILYLGKGKGETATALTETDITAVHDDAKMHPTFSQFSLLGPQFLMTR